MNTHVVFVKDLEQAVEAARKFAEDGVDGIELCSWFDMERTKAVIAAVEAVSKSIPVGSNGITI
jgi:methionine synthase I (cobalamin-dependent)